MATKSKLSRDGVLQLLRNHKKILKERFGVTEVSLYGSFARDEATDDSDIDLVVEFEETPSWHDFYGAQRYIQSISGRSVDMTRSRGIRKEIRTRVERDLTKV